MIQWRAFFLMICVASASSAQTQIAVEGQIRDQSSGRPLQYAFVVIHRTQNGVFCDSQGRFSMKVYADDTLLISQTGYLLEKVFLKNFTATDPLILNISLEMKPVQLRTFTVKAPKSFEQILKDLETAEQKKISAETPLVDAISSPITYLYQQFSRQEQSKRKIAELRSENTKKELFRELFTRYMLAHIIDLDEQEMDDFIAYSQIGDAYRKFETEYDLVVFIKDQYLLYRKGQE
jgi:hypothetical protein